MLGLCLTVLFLTLVLATPKDVPENVTFIEVNDKYQTDAERKEDYINKAEGFVPEKGFVPDAETAIKIAESILIPIYGKKEIEGERPLTAALKGDVWFVEGSLPKGYVGGVATVQLRKNDGGITKVFHSQ